jgi:fumarylpyruvate hydrolase
MPNYAINPPPVVTIPIEGSDQVFPVRRVYCIGRNYAAHAIEMGHDPNREPPFFFQKNPDNLYFGDTFPYPAQTKDVHHEVEMVVALKSGGKNIPVDKALDHVWGYGVGPGHDAPRPAGHRQGDGPPVGNRQGVRAVGPGGPAAPVSAVGHPASGLVQMKVNGKPKQTGDLNQMIWKVPEMIAYLSDYFELAAGDVIMTGTPAGVGPVVVGDVMECHVEGVDDVSFKVV